MADLARRSHPLPPPVAAGGTRVLVTGGFGFIGGHLVASLLSDPSTSVHVVDDLSSSPVPLSYYLATLDDRHNLTYDLCTIADYLARPDIPTFDHIYHLASPVGPAGVLRHGGDIVRSIVADTYLLMDACARSGARLLDVSTSEVYGGGQQGLCSEDAAKIVPSKTTIRLEYAVAKLAAETAIINTSAVKGLQATIIRPFNVAGPRQSPVGGFVIPRFLRQAHKNEPLTIFGDGRAVRAFTHVNDIVSGIRLAMASGASGTAYNVGNPANKVSISKLADQVISLLNSTSTTVLVDPTSIYGPLYAEANDKFPDSTRLSSELGWVPRHSMSDIIRDSYADFLQQLDRQIISRDDACTGAR